MVFVLAVLTVVAAGSLGLLVRTSKICTEKMAAAFTSFPVSLVGAVLRRSSSMLAIPLKRAFYLEKRGGEDSDGRSCDQGKNSCDQEKNPVTKQIDYQPSFVYLR